MHKRILLLVSAVSLSLFSFAQLKSPEAYLGYKIGTRYTPHWRVVSYYQYVAQTLPANVKLVQYGETNEHRPLYTAFISSPENISNLENIRMNNLRLANLSKDKAMPSENGAPAIVWLSYNVHGNETSSSEAGLLTIFALADPNNAQSKEWLKNTVVIMDPCVNPDGRDRYVNWFNSIVGAQYNPRLDSREHREPWPGGRSNHYNFDLNRDWAWQTQIESQQRIKLYNQWMPQVHVDFHEQSINSPYYFAPAAQPYHDAITKWQRDFQVTIGKNHAKYFDRNNWLYFTKEVFDLFYPSYGDTYPIYNGAIGMTYEQGGGGSSGLGSDTDEGDTLTLYDRAMHHFTTSLSTVEISSLNATNLLKEYRKFFNDAVSAANSEYKSYVIKNKPEDKERISALLTLLDKNGIQYNTGSGAGRGYSYHSGKEEAFSIGQGDIVISAAQPRSTMVRLLFEPQSKLVDSATYDITAWSMPYAYGLTAFASKTAVVAGGAFSKDSVKNSTADSYGYVIPWLGVSSARAIGQLMSAGIKMRFSESPFEVSGKSFARGAVIVLKKGNEKFGNSLWSEVAKICDQNNVAMQPVSTGFVDKGYDFGSGKVHPMKAVKVAMLTGDGVSSLGAGEVWHFFEKELRYPVTLINAADISRAKWSDIDVLIMPEGNYRFLSDKGSAEQFVLWVRNGGRVVALESAAGQLSRQDWSVIAVKKEDKDSSGKKDPYAALKLFNDRDRDGIENTTPGSIFRVDVDSSHPLMYGYPSYYYTLKMDDVLYEFTKDGAGWNAGVIKKDNQLAGFVGYKLKKKLKDGLLFATQDLGRGSVTYLTDDVLFRNFWENGKLMFCNAVFMVGQ
ncbi:M14 family metallopeptidase [Terrimonas sp. NA20]|uniref:M14 family metallopeptidase n=1 Tax=Terrimonas ginsenosidimutans TaxID=2908004 RepID=A0ABS9KZ93_9BACT|nr:M14 family metallopeptidase [Terrimonas ginsenosidimutans]MCG2617645.1 M14 family metallopeptidase [Terrimonas ginsenosidimutans]